MRTTKIGNALLLALLVLPFAACRTAEFQVTQAPKEPLHEFLQVEVLPIRTALTGRSDSEVLQDAQNIAEVIQTRLAQRFEKSKMFEHAGRKLLVTGRIVEFEPGSQAERYFIGPCVGQASLLMEVTLTDERGSQVAYGTVRAELSGGFFGGSLSSLGKTVADTVFTFIKNNYKVIPKPPEPPVTKVDVTP